MKRYFFLGLNFILVLLSIWLHDKFRVWMAGRLGDADAAARQRSAENPFARVDWIGSVLLPFYLLFRGLPVLGWTKPLEIEPENLGRPYRDGLLIAAAGPAANLLLAVMGIGLGLGLQAAGLFPSQQWGNLLVSFCLVNTNLMVFNLLPIPPLAAAMAAEVFLNGDALSAFEDIKPYGFLLLLAGVYFNFFNFLTTPITRLVMAILGF
ncbi:MAG: site-2 protease family protein [Candidatus Aminicenantes bacterium]|nr:site-2 protease family protein [Candidatus Aminicenantes bacterium]